MTQTGYKKIITKKRIILFLYSVSYKSNASNFNSYMKSAGKFLSDLFNKWFSERGKSLDEIYAKTNHFLLI